MNIIDKISNGDIFNKWVVIDVSPTKLKGKQDTYIKCRCSCGNEKYITPRDLWNNRTKMCRSCQVAIKNSKHNMCGTKVYNTWKAIRKRCYNKNTPQYKNWGGRGITVCDRWLNSFDNFLVDMGEPPSKEYSIDRINNNGNYCKDNCHWATILEQANNKRSNHVITYKGKTHNIKQ